MWGSAPHPASLWKGLTETFAAWVNGNFTSFWDEKPPWRFFVSAKHTKPTKRAFSLFGLWHCAPSAFSWEGLKMTRITNQILPLQIRSFVAIPKTICPVQKFLRVVGNFFQKVPYTFPFADHHKKRPALHRSAGRFLCYLDQSMINFLIFAKSSSAAASSARTVSLMGERRSRLKIPMMDFPSTT